MLVVWELWELWLLGAFCLVKIEEQLMSFMPFWGTGVK